MVKFYEKVNTTFCSLQVNCIHSREDVDLRPNLEERSRPYRNLEANQILLLPSQDFLILDCHHSGLLVQSGLGQVQILDLVGANLREVSEEMTVVGLRFHHCRLSVAVHLRVDHLLWVDHHLSEDRHRLGDRLYAARNVLDVQDLLADQLAAALEVQEI